MVDHPVPVEAEVVAGKELVKRLVGLSGCSSPQKDCRKTVACLKDWRKPVTQPLPPVEPPLRGFVALVGFAEK